MSVATCDRCGEPIGAEPVCPRCAPALDPYRTGTIVLQPGAAQAFTATAVAPPVEVKVKGFLTREGGPPAEADVRLRGGLTVVGRVEGDVVVEDPELSARHFQVEERDGRFKVRDLDSRNGTFLNDRRVSSAPLRTGDRIRAGSTRFTFSIRHAIPT